MTWLVVTLGCDYSSPDLTLSRIVTPYTYNNPKQNLRKKITILKIAVLYITYPSLVILTIVGALQQSGPWCTVSEITLVDSSAVTLVSFALGVGLFLKRRGADPLVSVKVAIILSRPK